MALVPGTRLGPYTITGVLGRGGMGEVYRARDTRLDRDVALKLLTDDAGDAPERLLHEARSASALNHPNICTLHEIGEAGGRPFMVMELVDGEPLDQRIGGRGLRLPDVLRFGAQIADALAHAHARGVIHRDLKAPTSSSRRTAAPRFSTSGLPGASRPVRWKTPRNRSRRSRAIADSPARCRTWPRNC